MQPPSECRGAFVSAVVPVSGYTRGGLAERGTRAHSAARPVSRCEISARAHRPPWFPPTGPGRRAR